MGNVSSQIKIAKHTQGRYVQIRDQRTIGIQDDRFRILPPGQPFNTAKICLSRLHGFYEFDHRQLTFPPYDEITLGRLLQAFRRHVCGMDTAVHHNAIRQRLSYQLCCFKYIAGCWCEDRKPDHVVLPLLQVIFQLL